LSWDLKRVILRTMEIVLLCRGNDLVAEERTFGSAFIAKMDRYGLDPE